jgi:hypothetical protein
MELLRSWSQTGSPKLLTPRGLELPAAITQNTNDLGNQPSSRAAKSGADSAASAPSDPDLARLIDAWPTLPGPIRRAVLALVNSGAD